MANEYDYVAANSSSNFYNSYYTETPNLTFNAGKIGSSGSDGALRFTGVTIPQGEDIVTASLNLYRDSSNDASNGDLTLYVAGIDEDNTSAFSGSPMGRSRTTASYTHTIGLPSVNNGIGLDVTDCVQEIVDRSGWSSGNAMGFVVLDNASQTNVNINDTMLGTNSYLTVLQDARPDFTPTPIKLNASTSVPENTHGIIIAKSGKTADLSKFNELNFTNIRHILKAKIFGNIGRNVDKVHGFGYMPMFSSYVIFNGEAFKNPILNGYGGGGQTNQYDFYAMVDPNFGVGESVDQFYYVFVDDFFSI